MIIINTLRLGQNARHFTDDIFKYIFLHENALMVLKFSLKIIPKVRINNIPALVQIMAWRRTGDKPLSEPMMVRFLKHLCVTWPQWVKACYCHYLIPCWLSIKVVLWHSPKSNFTITLLKLLHYQTQAIELRVEITTLHSQKKRKI